MRFCGKYPARPSTQKERHTRSHSLLALLELGEELKVPRNLRDSHIDRFGFVSSCE